METNSDTDSSEMLGDWDFILGPEFDHAIPPPKEMMTSVVPDKEKCSTSTVAAGGGEKEKAARRILPPWMEPSHEWGGGKWKEDGRKNRKKEKEKESEEIIPFKEIIEALLRNSGEKVEEDEARNGKSQSCVEMLKSKGFKFP